MRRNFLKFTSPFHVRLMMEFQIKVYVCDIKRKVVIKHCWRYNNKRKVFHVSGGGKENGNL